MKDAKQFFEDYTANEELQHKLIEEMNRLRMDADMEFWQAGQKAAHALGYELPDDVARKLADRFLHRSGSDAEELTEEELSATAGGSCYVGAIVEMAMNGGCS